MGVKDLHAKPFDEGTIAKLEIFEAYAEAWLPTFIMQGRPSICVFDFFAGTGRDQNGVDGSPIRILKQIKGQIGNIFQKKVKIKVFFNEFKLKKFELLKSACEEYLLEHKDVSRAIEIVYFNEDFATLFPKLLNDIRQYPSLVYLDQNGIKFLSNDFLLPLAATKETDFLYFVSSSYFWRFGDSEEFKEHFDMDMSEAKRNPYKMIHVTLLNQLKKSLPKSNELKLYPFSIKKGPNIYGIVFGASHIRAVEKFLSIAWKHNRVNGTANFDIDDEANRTQLSLFEGVKPTKIEGFKQRLKEKVITAEVTNNLEAFNFAMEEGHLGSHAAEALKELKVDKNIYFEGSSPLVTYDNAYKNQNFISYKILKK